MMTTPTPTPTRTTPPTPVTPMTLVLLSQDGRYPKALQTINDIRTRTEVLAKETYLYGKGYMK